MMIKHTPALLLALGLTACVGPHDDLQQWMNDTRQAAKANLQQPEPPQLPTPASYTPPINSNMNAFNSARLKMGMQGSNAPDMNRPKEVLENFSLENLLYVGSLSGAGKATSAYVSADNHVYTVKVGNYLGQNYGRITAIHPDKLIITEQVEDTYGEWTQRQVEMPLNEPVSNQN
ncbi:type IV pilus assembly protein PilP [Neisseria sp. HSC-16F19]|nr:pilus assembly protein PilP [Neisseria sp. HSC-16F19]MCP2041254.1 type IV pilus assembly protein PilP [Neisseria sp. HSC-16F19]